MNWIALLLKRLLPSMRSVRLATYFTLTFGALALVSARAVYADAREIALGVGHELSSLGDVTAGAYRIHINGASMYRASARTTQPLKEVLDRYQAYCAMSPSILGRAMTDVPQALEEHVDIPKGHPLRQGIVREEDERRGMVACFADDGKRLDGLNDRLRAFRETSDLSVFGRFHYVFAKRTDGGDTHVVTLWSEGSLNVSELFPSSGDAPGTDSPMTPRPTKSRRTFSAWADGYPAAVRIYEVASSRDLVEREYDAQLVSKGFTKVKAGEAIAYVGGDGSEIILSLTEQGSRTFATVVEAGASSVARIQSEVTQP